VRPHQAVIGFDRRLKIEWLDRAATIRIAHEKPADVRTALDAYLRTRVSGDAKGGARAKTRSVLMRTWALPRPESKELLKSAIALFSSVPASQRIALHWGLLIANYPFFFDTAMHIGRLLRLQDTIELSQATRRITESWGQRSTVPRAVQRIVRSLVDWRALIDAKNRGEFARTAKPIDVSSESLSMWLVEAVVVASRGKANTAALAIQHPALFPFVVHVTPSGLAKSELVEVVRHGLNESVVVLRTAQRSGTQKRLSAEAELDKTILKEAAKGTF